MKVFAYGRDPLCLIAMGCYVINRWALKPALNIPFLENHFNDLLLIPAALPLVLWVQRQLKWRQNDLPPSISEISLHLIMWGLIAEVAGPHLIAHATGDWRDLLAYAAGAVFAGFWWHHSSTTSATKDHNKPSAP